MVGGTKVKQGRESAVDSFSALSRAVVGGTKWITPSPSRIERVSVLSVEPWLVELFGVVATASASGVSVLSVEPWLVEPELGEICPANATGFSALSRAVVGGTLSYEIEVTGPYCFSALSRAVVGGTSFSRLMFLRSRSFSALSRAVVGGTKWITPSPSRIERVSVLSVEPWLVELFGVVATASASGVSVLSVEPWLVEPCQTMKR